MAYKKCKYALLCSIACFAIFSMSFFLIIVSDFNGILIQHIFTYMVDGLFGLDLLVVFILTVYLSSRRRKNLKGKEQANEIT